MPSKSKKYYDNNPKAKAKKDSYNTKYQKKRAKLKVRSHKTGKMVQYKSDLKNREREDKAKGIDTSKMDYDHTDKKRKPKSENRGDKKRIIFKVNKK